MLSSLGFQNQWRRTSQSRRAENLQDELAQLGLKAAIFACDLFDGEAEGIVAHARTAQPELGQGAVLRKRPVEDLLFVSHTTV